MRPFLKSDFLSHLNSLTSDKIIGFSESDRQRIFITKLSDLHELVYKMEVELEKEVKLEKMRN